MCYHACLIFSCGHTLLSDLPVMSCRVQTRLTAQANDLGIGLEVQKTEFLQRLASGCQARVMSPDSRNLEHQKRPCDDCLLARMQKIKDQMEFDRLFDFYHKNLRDKFLALQALLETVEEGTSDRYYTGEERPAIITIGISGVRINIRE
ncbi:hypothetical protein HOY82DRAFT_542913 [Tuber indicum]|nr:hypothetical protein HOY82DRAFT_542913 [Tuber indicum]